MKKTRLFTAILTALLFSFQLHAQDPNYEWGHGIGSGNGGIDRGYSTVTDSSGNVYVTGSFQGTVDFDPSVITAYLIASGGRDIFLAKFDASGNYLWAKNMGGTSYNDSHSLALDGSGNAYITGHFQGTVDFDPSGATANLSPVGTQDIFLAKYDVSGNYLWAKSMGGTDYDIGYSVAIDGSGNAYVTGVFQGTADFDPSGATGNLTSAGSYDFFLAKYDASGNYLWAKGMGGTGFDFGRSVALDGSGNACITGNFEGTADFDPSGATANLTSAGSNDIYLAKYDASGNYLWAKGMGGTSSDVGQSVALDGSGNAYITGYFQGTADFDPSGATANLSSAGYHDIFLARYDASGNYLWAKSMGGTEYDIGQSVALDDSGNAHITGYFYGTVDFDPSGATANLISAGYNDIFLAKYDASGNYLWAKSMGGTSGEEGNSIALDGSGNAYITGYFYGTADFDPSGATANLTSVLNNSVFVGKYDAATGDYSNAWATEDGQGGADFGNSTITDGSDNVYVTGNFQGKVDFDPSAATAYLTSSGGYDIFLAKYDASGNYLWAKSMGGTSSDYGVSVALDGSGNTYIAGYFQDTADFDPSGATASLTSAGSNDIFLAKYDASGNYLWAKSMGGTSSDYGASVALDGSGNPYVTGYFSGTADFDPSGATANLTSAGNQDIFFAKYDASGNYLWAKSIGGASNDVGQSIALGGSGNAYVTGNFAGTADFDPSGATASLTSAGNNDIFLAKYDASGNYLWAKSIGGTSNDVGHSIALDGSSGNAYVTGNFAGTADFDPSGATANLISAGYSDIFLAKYDASGNYLWAKGMGGTSYDYSQSVSLDGSGNAYVSGYFQGTADFDPSGATANLTSAGYHDVFLAKYDASGNYLWAKGMGGTGYDYGSSVALDGSGNAYITGYFWGTSDFDPSAVTANITSQGNYDIFLAKYNQCVSTSASITETACDSLVSPSGNYTWTISGNYNDTIPNAAGCDSVITVDLTINYSNTGTDVQTACDSYLWIDGVTYTSSNNTAKDTLINAAGCDSVVTLDLTINYSNTGTDVQTACDSYLWIDGVTYTSSNNTATHTLTNSAGCDSVVTLDLTINYSNTGTDGQTACDSYLWIDGITYTSSNNTATQTLTNATGCDSVVTLDLTINYSNTGTDVQTACDSYLWINGITYTSSNNTATQTLTNAAGCDSVVTLDLTINYSNTGTDVQTACDSYLWIDGVTYTSSNNTATQTLSNTAGCDSVVTLDLTINYSNTGTDVQTACDSYTWIDGLTYTSSNNTATHTLTNAAGCDSMVTLDLTINAVDTTVTRNGNTLTANVSGAAYQWIDCLNDDPDIINETDQSYTPETNGEYAVIITENSCTDTSSCYTITGVGIENAMSGMTVQVYPNPTTGSVTVNLGAEHHEVHLSVRNALGQEVYHQQEKTGSTFNITLPSVSGVYFIKGSSKEGNWMKKVVVQ